MGGTTSALAVPNAITAGEKKMAIARIIDNKVFILYRKYPSQRGARLVAAKIRNEVPEKGYHVRVVKVVEYILNAATGRRVKHIWYGVYTHDGTKKPWRS